MSRAPHFVAVLLLLAASVVACTDTERGAGTTTAVDLATQPAPAPPEPAAGDGRSLALEAAFEFAACMRDNGIANYPDPQERADGDFFLSPPADVEDDELTMAEAACEHLAAPFRTTPTTPPTHVVGAGWERIVPGGDCQCADGSEFSFWVRRADPDKVLVYLQDGGVCFSAETCAPGSDGYVSAIEEGPPAAGGIFDVADERNPFADHTIVYVPYCTGDAHLGNTTREYGPGLTIRHRGYVNGTAALDHVATIGSGAGEVVVVGESAGALAAPLYGGLMSDRFPDSTITVLADGSGSFPDVPRLNEIIAGWGFGGPIPPWPENTGPTAEPWSFPGLFIASGRHARDIVFARHDYAYDERQRQWYPIAGVAQSDLLALIDTNEAQIEAAGVDLHSYVAPGEEHTTLSDGTFYTETVNGEPLVDWVTKLIEHQPVEDVHCIDCTTD